MRELQFSIVVLTTLMCSALILLLPVRVRRDAVINRSRWLMVGALGLIGVQFLVQYVTQLRSRGVTQAVLVNLLFFVPASGLMSLSVLNLQRQGQLRNIERWLWAAVSLLMVAVIVLTLWAEEQPINGLSERVKWVEIVMGVVYAAMQVYYSSMQFRELERMQTVIENYFDSEHRGLTQWMKHAITVTGLLAMFVPILIFGPNILLIVYGLVFFWGLFMMWFCFVRYFTSNDMKRVREAEANAVECASEECKEPHVENQEMRLPPDTLQHIGHAVERWIANGSHLKAGITSPLAAEAMNIPRYQLTAWVKASGYSSFTRWITTLRIEEAKKTLKQHPDWNNEAVADHCGFSRTHFQKIFKQETGVAPSNYAVS